MLRRFKKSYKLFKNIKPYSKNFLENDGHKIYYEECGNPHGKPAVFPFILSEENCLVSTDMTLPPKVSLMIGIEDGKSEKLTPHLSY